MSADDVRPGRNAAHSCRRRPPGRVGGRNGGSPGIRVQHRGVLLARLDRHGRHATIDGAQGGPNYYGLLVDQADADVTNSLIENIGEAPPNGTQHGIGVAYVSGDVSGSGDSAPGVDIAPVSGTVANNTIQRYQKGGVVVAGSQADVTTDNNLVQGLGPVSFIAQNGIQYSRGAAGQIFTNTVTDNYYTGSDTYSTGIMLYDINPPEINKYNNFYRDDQRNLIVVPSSSLK